MWLISAFSAIALLVPSAQANLIVTVGGTQYDLNPVPLPFDAHASTFEASAIWHQPTLALEIATAAFAQQSPGTLVFYPFNSTPYSDPAITTTGISTIRSSKYPPVEGIIPNFGIDSGEGAGADPNIFQLINVTIHTAGVPDAGSTLALLGLAVVGCAGLRKRFTR